MTGVLDAAGQRGITRLCHFTKSVHLAQILRKGEIRPVADLTAAKDAYRGTDPTRRDGFPDHVNCSIEYPNSWYLRKARNDDPNFTDWVVLCLDVALLDRDEVRFCPFNSARNNGSAAACGTHAFEAMFALEVTGARGLRRDSRHPAWWPTDDQAEVLVPGSIPLKRIGSVIVRSEEQAASEVHRLTRLTDPKDDPVFTVRAADVCDLYLNPPPNCVRLSIDEKTAIAARSRKHPGRPAGPGRPAHQEFEYVRHGTVSIVAAFDIDTGQTLTQVIARNDSATFEAFLTMLDQMIDPAKDIHVVLDNGSSHVAKNTRTWLAAHPRWHIHWTPVHASWLTSGPKSHVNLPSAPTVWGRTCLPSGTGR